MTSPSKYPHIFTRNVQEHVPKQKGQTLPKISSNYVLHLIQSTKLKHSTLYSIGCLFGVPGLRGYFLGVVFTLLIVIIVLSLSSSGNKKL